MAEYDLGTAKGRIVIDPSGAVAGISSATAAQGKFTQSQAASAAAIGRTGKVMVGAGAAIVGGLALSVRAAANFEKGMNKVAAVSGATEAEMSDLADMAKELGRTTKFSASEAAEGMSFLAMAGFDTNEMLDAMPGVLNLAAAGNLDLARAADIASNVLTGYGLKADEIGRVNDVMAATASNANTDINQLGDAMSFVAPVAVASGLALEETSAAIGKLSDAGIQGGRAGTTLRQIIASLENQTPKATEAIERLGISTHDSEGNLRSMVDIVRQFEEAGLSTADAMTIFGTRAGPGMSALVSQGADSLEELRDGLENSGGTAQRMADKQMEGLSGAFTKLKSATEGAMIAIGEQFLPILTRMVDFFAGAISKIGGLNENTLKTIAIFAAAAAGLLILSGAFLMAFNMVHKLRTAFLVLRTALMANPIILIVAALAALTAGLIYAYRESETFRNIVDGVFRAIRSVVEPIIQKIIEGVQAMKNAFDAADDFGFSTSDGFIGWMIQIGKFAREVIDGIQPMINAFKAADDFGFGTSDGVLGWMIQIGATARKVFGWIKKNVVPVVEKVVDAIGGWGNVLKIVGVAIAAIVAPWLTAIAAVIWAYNEFEVFRDIVNTVIDIIISVGETIIEFGRIAIEAFMSFVGWMRDNVFPLFVSLIELIQALYDRATPIFNLLINVIQIALNVIMTAITGFIAIVMNAWNLFGDNLLSVLSIAWNLIRGVVEAALKYITGIFNVFAGLLTGDWDKMWSGIKDMLAAVWDLMTTLLGAALDVIMLLIETALDVIHLAWDTAWQLIHTALDVAWELIKGVISAGIEFIVNVITQGLDIIANFFGTSWDKIWNAVKEAWERLKSTISSGIEAAKETVTSGIGSIVTWFTELPGKIVGALASLASSMAGEIQKAWDAWITVMTTMIRAVLSYFRGLPGDIISALGNLGTMLWDVGKQIIKGLINGIKSMVGAAADAVKSVVGGAVDAGKSLLGIGSPSKVFHQFGEWTGEGFAEGLESAVRGVRSAAEVMVSSSLEPASATPSAMARAVTNSAPAFSVPIVAGSSDSSVHVGQVVIDASSIQEMVDISDFFDRIQQTARQGVA